MLAVGEHQIPSPRSASPRGIAPRTSLVTSAQHVVRVSVWMVSDEEPLIRHVHRHVVLRIAGVTSVADVAQIDVSAVSPTLLDSLAEDLSEAVPHTNLRDAGRIGVQIFQVMIEALASELAEREDIGKSHGHCVRHTVTKIRPETCRDKTAWIATDRAGTLKIKKQDLHQALSVSRGFRGVSVSETGCPLTTVPTVCVQPWADGKASWWARSMGSPRGQHARKTGVNTHL